jgi:hypothetical protein
MGGVRRECGAVARIFLIYQGDNYLYFVAHFLCNSLLSFNPSSNYNDSCNNP